MLILLYLKKTGIKRRKTVSSDVFVIGDDWEGQFDYLRDQGVEVVYLPRTPEISTSRIKKDLHE